MLKLLVTIARLAAIAGFAAASWWTVRLSWADYLARRDTVEDLLRAVRVAPDNAAYHARAAQLLDDDPKAEAELRLAAAVNAYDARSWMELGLAAEAAGREDAERDLLRAAALDRKYLPRWTLANYYFRRGDYEQFWRWAKEAAAMAYGDATPLFRLCGSVAEDGRLVERLGIAKPEMRAQYLQYLLGQGRTELLASALDRVIETNRDTDVPVLLDACDRLLERGDVGSAAGLWNRLADGRRVGFQVTPEAGEVSNPEFRSEPVSRGFDWRLPAVNGVSLSQEESGVGLRLTFSGRQPEDVELMAQLAPVTPEAGYELSVDYESSGIGEGAGPAWQVTDSHGGRVLAAGPELPVGYERNVRLRFTAPAGCRIARVALRYRRQPGTTRAEGFLIVRKVAMRRAE